MHLAAIDQTARPPLRQPRRLRLPLHQRIAPAQLQHRRPEQFHQTMRPLPKLSAANTFLDALSAEERYAVLFEFANTEQLQRWSNLPEACSNEMD